MEKNLQTQIIKWLRSQGAYVIKAKSGPGTPVGCPDIIAFKEGFWLGLEVKATKNSVLQPGQERTVKVLDNWSFCKIVYPENWQEIKAQLQAILD